MKSRKLMNNYYGLGYIDVEVPIRIEKVGEEDVEVIDMDIADVEKLVAKTIIEEKVPIRGREVKFLRKVLGLSMEKFARNFDFSSAAILKWEKDDDKRLSLVNELAVRTFVNDMLNFEIEIKFFDLDSRSTSPKKVIKLAA
ncbi:MAG: hypothetical protein KAQ98_10245 [Bacteriovoracaceae bacterium]|nr:hypothetical protein [Bacteriovoracaceae bacterium]